MKNTEIEVKLLASKENLAKLLMAPSMAAVIRHDSCRKRKLSTVYYDTEDLAFKAHGIAYRVRANGDGTHEATVKCARSESAGMSERTELTLPLKNARPKLDGFAALGLEYELTDLAPAGVQKLFTVSVQRTTYVLKLPGAVAELAIDQGKIAAGRATEKIDELEIELVEGEKGALLDFIAQITAEVPLFVEKRSKYERGMALRGIAPEAPACKGRLGAGELKEEVGAALAQHGDALLALQEEARTQADERVLKNLRKELLALRALAALLGIEELPQIGEALAKITGARRLLALQALWQFLRERDKNYLGRTYLHIKLADRIDEAAAAVRQMAEGGSFTAIVCKLNSLAYAAQAEAADAESAGKALLKKYKQELAQIPAAEDVEAQLALADNVAALGRLFAAKSFAKAAENCKKQRRQLQKQAVSAFWDQVLLEIYEISMGKVIVRDIGYMQGYLAAKK